MAVRIAPLSLVDPRAQLADDVEIGPFCVVGPDVIIGPGTRLDGHVQLQGHVELGAGNRIFPHVVIGGEPQDLSYRGEPTSVVIGDRNVIREGVTINRGTIKEQGRTIIGNDCFLMANSHIAHDCRVGNRVVIANGTLLAGHVHVHDDAALSGGVGVHHFTTIGGYSFVAGMSRVLQDVPPYMLVEGNPARPRCINLVALRRRHFSAEIIAELAEAHRLLYRAHVGLREATEQLQIKGLLSEPVRQLLDFVKSQQAGNLGRGRESRRNAA